MIDRNFRPVQVLCAAGACRIWIFHGFVSPVCLLLPSNLRFPAGRKAPSRTAAARHRAGRLRDVTAHRRPWFCAGPMYRSPSAGLACCWGSRCERRRQRFRSSDRPLTGHWDRSRWRPACRCCRTLTEYRTRVVRRNCHHLSASPSPAGMHKPESSTSHVPLLPCQREVALVATQERAGFIVGVTDDHWDVRRLGRSIGIERMTLQRELIENRRERHVAKWQHWISDADRLQQSFCRHGASLSRTPWGKLQCIQYCSCTQGRVQRPGSSNLLAAHGSSAVEESTC